MVLTNSEDIDTDLIGEYAFIDDVANHLCIRLKLTGTILGEEKGPKIRALTYKAKSIQRKRWGHRQHYTSVEITKISPKA